MKKILLLCIIFVASTSLYAGATYSILKDENKRNIKRTIEVVFSEKITEQELKQFALSVKNSTTETYQMIFIGYYIQGADMKNGYWASTHFTPKLDVNILGLSIKEEAKLKNIKLKECKKGCEVLLSWNTESSKYKTTIFSKNNNFYLVNFFLDGSGGKAENIKVMPINDNETKITTKNDFGEYFIYNKQLQNIQLCSEEYGCNTSYNVF